MTSPRTRTEKTKAKVKVKKVAKGKKTNGAAPHDEPANEVQPSNRGASVRLFGWSLASIPISST